MEVEVERKLQELHYEHAPEVQVEGVGEGEGEGKFCGQHDE